MEVPRPAGAEVRAPALARARSLLALESSSAGCLQGLCACSALLFNIHFGIYFARKGRGGETSFPGESGAPSAVTARRGLWSGASERFPLWLFGFSARSWTLLGLEAAAGGAGRCGEAQRHPGLHSRGLGVPGCPCPCLVCCSRKQPRPLELRHHTKPVPGQGGCRLSQPQLQALAPLPSLRCGLFCPWGNTSGSSNSPSSCSPLCLTGGHGLLGWAGSRKIFLYLTHCVAKPLNVSFFPLQRGRAAPPAPSLARLRYRSLPSH